MLHSPVFVHVFLLHIGCPRFHLFPRFGRFIEDDGKELLSPAVILNYLLSSSRVVINDEQLPRINEMSDSEWAEIAIQVKDQVVVFPGRVPCAIRVDQIDRSADCPEKPDVVQQIPAPSASQWTTSGTSTPSTATVSLSTSPISDSPDGMEIVSDDDMLERSQCSEPHAKEHVEGPVIVHFGVRPPQLSYAGNPKYQKAWRDYVKFRHLLANKPKVNATDRKTLLEKEQNLQEMRQKSDLKRDVTVEVSAKNCYKTGLGCDVIQHSLLVPVVICHLRFHQALVHLGEWVA